MQPERHRYCPACQVITLGRFCGKCGKGLADEPRVLGGRYVLTGPKLGEGGMGIVLVAYQPAVRTKVAVKLLHRHLSDDPGMVRRILDVEAAAGVLRHPNIIQVLDAERTPEGDVYIATEHLQGQTLEALRRKEGALHPGRALSLWRQAVAGVAEAHRQGIIHRDLKPENLFVIEEEGLDESRELVKVLDFGIAKIQEAQRAAGTAKGDILCTFWYAAPEQLDGSGNVDARVDVYALGLILYQMLSGEMPWPGSPDDVRGAAQRLVTDPAPLEGACPHWEFPVPLLALMQEMLSRASALRPAHAGVVQERIREILKKSPPSSWPRKDQTETFPIPGPPPAPVSRPVIVAPQGDRPQPDPGTQPPPVIDPPPTPPVSQPKITLPQPGPATQPSASTMRTVEAGEGQGPASGQGEAKKPLRPIAWYVGALFGLALLGGLIWMLWPPGQGPKPTPPPKEELRSPDLRIGDAPLPPPPIDVKFVLEKPKKIELRCEPGGERVQLAVGTPLVMKIQPGAKCVAGANQHNDIVIMYEDMKGGVYRINLSQPPQDQSVDVVFIPKIPKDKPISVKCTGPRMNKLWTLQGGSRQPATLPAGTTCSAWAKGHEIEVKKFTQLKQCAKQCKISLPPLRPR